MGWTSLLHRVTARRHQRSDVEPEPVRFPLTGAERVPSGSASFVRRLRKVLAG